MFSILNDFQNGQSLYLVHAHGM